MDKIKVPLLTRAEYINAVDSNKIWSKSLKIPEIKIVLEKLENVTKDRLFVPDNYFIMNNRRNSLLQMIDEKLQNKDGNPNEIVSDALFNFWEIVSNDYPGNLSLDSQRLGIPKDKLHEMDKIYREDGIISANELALFTLIIRKIKQYINDIESSN